MCQIPQSKILIFNAKDPKSVNKTISLQLFTELFSRVFTPFYPNLPPKMQKTTKNV